MSYATLDYYKTTYQGAIDTDANITKYLARASDDIDIACGLSFTYADLDAVYQELVQKATCAQAENYVINGDGLGDIASLSIGSFSVSDTGAKNGSAQRPVLASRAVQFLALTGLMNRSVRRCYP